MRIILTHEIADFDAIGSLLGAYLVDNGLTPILPETSARAVKNYLTTYGKDLPFVPYDSIKDKAIDEIVLVDTQKFPEHIHPTGLVNVRVFDHHSKRIDIPESWNTAIEKTAACTTHFIRKIVEKYAVLPEVWATLLYLAIQQDSGSFTYTSTTSQDLEAASWLLKYKPDLAIVLEYLTFPLSTSQQILYESSVVRCRNYSFNGFTIGIVILRSTLPLDEIAGVANRLRFHLDIDALFMIIQAQDGIRLIGRSNHEDIDVSKVSTFWGVTGNKKGITVFIPYPESEKKPDNKQILALGETVQETVLAILRSFLHHQPMVGEIMSLKPATISSRTSIKDAAFILQRTGFEGIPVLDHNRVKGMITRRTIDRAIAHGLDVNVDSLIEMENVTVSPHDTIDQLEAKMHTANLGQVAVVNPSNQQLVGIVTRTDVFKTRAIEKNRIGVVHLAENLKKNLPNMRYSLLRFIARIAEKKHIPIYIVGGFVRDLILGKESSDFDIVVEGNAIDLAHELNTLFGGRVITHPRFGTAKWKLSEIDFETYGRTIGMSPRPVPEDLPEYLDFIGARNEYYEYPAALPTVEHGSIKLDLRRRDFSINTLAIRLDGDYFGQLYDFLGGLRDLNKGVIRVLHPLSFIDDPTRILRAMRFEQRFGFSIEKRSMELLHEGVPFIKKVSGERLRNELILALQEEQSAQILSRFNEKKILHAIHPYFKWNDEISSRIERVKSSQIPDQWGVPASIYHHPIKIIMQLLTWSLSCSADQRAAIHERINIPLALRDTADMLQALEIFLPSLILEKPSVIVKKLRTIPDYGLLTLYLLQEDDKIKAIIDQYICEWRNVKPVTDSKFLIAMGIPPSPRLGEILDALKYATLDGVIGVEDEPEFIRRFLEETSKLT